MAGRSRREIIEEWILSELLSGEEILWADQPSTRRLFTLGDLLRVPFTLMWAGFALFWNIMVWSMDAPIFFRLWGLPFLLVGVYITFGRFFYLHWRKVRTYYVVTDRRLLIFNFGPRRNLDAFALHDLSTLRKRTGRNGVGSIIFGQAQGRYNNSIDMSNTGMESFGYTVPGFYDIAYVNEVYTLINELRYGKKNSFIEDDEPLYLPKAKRKRA